MAKKKTVKSAPVKSARNSEHDYTFKNENMGAYRFDKDCYVSMKVNRTSLDVALGAIIDGETYTTTANLTGGSGGASTMIRYNVDGEPGADVEIVSGNPYQHTPAIWSSCRMSIRINEGEWEECTINDDKWHCNSANGVMEGTDNWIFALIYSYDSTVKLKDGDTVDFKWEV